MFSFVSSHRVKVALAGIASAVGTSLVVLTVTSLLGISLNPRKAATRPIYYSTQTGESLFIWLEPDLTVTLNAASRIAVDFAEHQRRVRLLSGEALFRDDRQSRGLHVEIGSLDINALRATVDVRSYERVTEVTVIDGQLILQCACFDATTPTIMLKAGEQFYIDPWHFQRRVLTQRDREHLVGWDTLSD